MILCLGEVIVDLVCERELSEPGEADHFVPHPGGALANVAVAARRAGGASALLGGVGDDAWGNWLRERLWHEKVDVRFLETVTDHATPVAFVTFDWEREPTFAIYGEGIAATMRAAAVHLEAALSEATALIFGSNTLVGEPERELTLEARRTAMKRGVPVIFDPNLRPNRWRNMDRAVALCRDLIEGSFLVRANRDEAQLLTGQSDPATAAAELDRRGARLGVVTLGSDGAVMRGSSEAELKAPKVEVVSPMGAGDAFVGAFAAGMEERGWQEELGAEALPAALEAGARACTTWGAQA